MLNNKYLIINILFNASALAGFGNFPAGHEAFQAGPPGKTGKTA